MIPTAATRTFALLGDPVVHSLSPVMQNAAFLDARLDAVYVALRCSSTSVGELVTGLARAGGGGNVTLPHKAAIITLLERRTDAVLRSGVCNTFWLEDGKICGDNTDVVGFGAAADALVGSRSGMRTLVIGAGAAARAAILALAAAGAGDVVVLNRSKARADAMITELAKSSTSIRVVPSADLSGEEFDLITNATPLGLGVNDALPLDLRGLRRAGAALDMVYRPGGTPWTQHACSLGIPAADGLEMLLAQGAAAFERWWARPAPVLAMRVALERAARPGPHRHGDAPQNTTT